jgi:hypothetical protein
VPTGAGGGAEAVGVVDDGAGREGLGFLALHAVPGEGGGGVVGAGGLGEVEGGDIVGPGGLPLPSTESNGGRVWGESSADVPAFE